MCNNPHSFKEWHTLENGARVVVGDGKKLRATRRGTVNLDMTLPHGISKCVLHEVLLVPDLAYELLRQEEGLISICRGAISDKTVEKGHRNGGFYYPDHQITTERACVVSASVHQREADIM